VRQAIESPFLDRELLAREAAPVPTPNEAVLVRESPFLGPFEEGEDAPRAEHDEARYPERAELETDEGAPALETEIEETERALDPVDEGELAAAPLFERLRPVLPTLSRRVRQLVERAAVLEAIERGERDAGRLVELFLGARAPRERVRARGPLVARVVEELVRVRGERTPQPVEAESEPFAAAEEEALGSVAFPSGEALRVVSGYPTGEHEEFWDPWASGNPLLDTSAAQKDKKLSSSFTVRELTSSGGVSADVARIDPGLVRCLQRLRDHVGKAVRITSGFRSWKRNKKVYDDRGEAPKLSQHCSGRAADVQIQGMSGLEIAKAAIDAYGPNLGVGLAPDFAHVDVRGYAEAWAYKEVSAAWVAEIGRYQRERGGRARSGGAAPQARPSPAAVLAEVVRFAQRVLNATEGERLDDDGALGPLTRAALERFRRKHSLGAGGTLDERTELALAQRALEELAEQSLFEKGKRDAAIDQVLSAFKAERGLGGEPTLDAATRAALTEALARPRPATLPRIAPAPALAAATVDWVAVPAGERMRHVMRLLVSRYGYPANGAAGIVGNLWAESGVLPNRIEGSPTSAPMRAPNFAGAMADFTPEEVMNRDRGARRGPLKAGIGLAQWTTRGRRAGLFTHTFEGHSLGAAILHHMDAQVNYLVTELAADYRRVDAVLRRAGVSVEEASDEVVYGFEIPGAILAPRGPDGVARKLPRTDPAVVAVFERRRGFSKKALKAYREAVPA
jgi:hypothetical protein